MTAIAYVVKHKNVDGYDAPFKAGDVKLFPGSFPMRVDIPIKKFSSEEISALRDKRQFLYLAGKIEYEDGFGFGDSNDFGFEYTPEPKEGWIAVSTPVAQMKEALERKASSLGPVTIVTPSPERSPVLTPTDKPSPLASVTVTPRPLMSHTFRITSKTSPCGCSCMLRCNNVCEFETSNCGVVEGMEAAQRCCEAARDSVGDTGPCTDQN